jgi:hypothetical protein
MSTFKLVYQYTNANIPHITFIDDQFNLFKLHT